MPILYDNGAIEGAEQQPEEQPGWLGEMLLNFEKEKTANRMNE